MHKNDNPDLPCSSPKLPLDCAYYLNITPLLDADILWLSTSTSDLYRKYLSANRQIKKSIKEYSLAYKDSNKASNNQQTAINPSSPRNEFYLRRKQSIVSIEPAKKHPQHPHHRKQLSLIENKLFDTRHLKKYSPPHKIIVELKKLPVVGKSKKRFPTEMNMSYAAESYRNVLELSRDKKDIPSFIYLDGKQNNYERRRFRIERDAFLPVLALDSRNKSCYYRDYTPARNHYIPENILRACRQVKTIHRGMFR